MSTARAIACLLFAIAAGVAGCSLTRRQQADIARWQVEAADLGHPEVRYSEDLGSGKAVGLGFLPFGIAGFYVHRPGLAVSGFLWPLSITWVPAVAGVSARNYNFAQFRARIIALRQEAQARAPASVPGAPAPVPYDAGAALDQLSRLRAAGKITDAEYETLRRRIIDRIGQP